MKSAISVLLVLFIMLTSIGLVSAGDGDMTPTNSDITPSGNDTSGNLPDVTPILLPINPLELYDGSLYVKFLQNTAHVNDTVQIEVTASNNGFCDWCPLMIYVPVPNGLQFLSFYAQGLTMQNYDPSTGIWNVYRMRDFNRGSTKTALITVKVPQSAEGKTFQATARFNTLVLEGYGIDYASHTSPARPDTLTILKKNETPPIPPKPPGNNGGTIPGKSSGNVPGLSNALLNSNGNSLIADKISNIMNSLNKNPLLNSQAGGGSGTQNKIYGITKVSPIKSSDSLGYIFAILLVIGMIGVGIYIELKRSQ